MSTRSFSRSAAVTLHRGADLVGDLIDYRVQPVVEADQSWQIKRAGRSHDRRLSGQSCADGEVDPDATLLLHADVGLELDAAAVGVGLLVACQNRAMADVHEPEMITEIASRQSS